MPQGRRNADISSTQKCMSVSTELCDLCAKQSSGLQLACFPRAHSNIKILSVCVGKLRRAVKLQLQMFLINYFYMFRSLLTETYRMRKRGVSRSMLCAVCVFVCVPREKKCRHTFNLKVHECISTEIKVLFARQSSGLQLACFPLAHLNIKMLIVCV